MLRRRYKSIISLRNFRPSKRLDYGLSFGGGFRVGLARRTHLPQGEEHSKNTAISDISGPGNLAVEALFIIL
jgi:hypothetical protein